MNKRSLTTKLTGTRGSIATTRALKPILLIALLLLSFAACERRPLEVYEKPVALVKVELDWMEHFGQKPHGMMMLVYDETDSLYKAIGPVHEVESQVLSLEVGTYKLVFCNYPEDESFYVARMGNHYYASARAEWMKGHPYSYWEKEAYREAPEDIGVAVDTITITEDMVRSDVRFVEYTHRDELNSDTTQFVFPEVPDPMTVKLIVKAKVKRRHSISTIDASISGMADGFYLSQVNRTTDRATFLIPNEEWHRAKYGTEADSMGVIYAEIASFGLPHGKELLSERDSTDNVLTFHFVLTNDSVQDFTYKVGKEIKYLTPTGREAQIRKRQDLHDLKIELDLSDVIVIAPTPSTRTGQGFDAKVEDWEDGGAFDIGF